MTGSIVNPVLGPEMIWVMPLAPSSLCDGLLFASLQRPQVETLAEKAGMTPRTFARTYSSRTGMTPASVPAPPRRIAHGIQEPLFGRLSRRIESVSQAP
jgi:AraC-like DNA-binding protein